MNTIINVKDPVELLKVTRELFRGMQSQYLGIADKAPDEFKPMVQELQRKVDAALKELDDSPSSQVPAALDASSTLNSLCHMLNYMKELVDGAMNRMTSMMAEMAPKTQALHSLETRVNSGELMPKDKLQEAVDTALKTERDRVKLLSSRRTLLAGANLPSPLDDEILAGDDAAFKTIQTDVTGRLAELDKNGLRNSLEAGDLSALCYGAKDEFERVVRMAAKAAKTGNGPVAEPFAGGAGSASSSAGGNSGKLRRMV